MYIASNGIKTAVISFDYDATSPRDRDYQENLGKMICWHPRYNLGDKHRFADGHEFLKHLVEEHLDSKDVFRGIRDGLVEGYQLTDVDNFLIKGEEYGPSYNLEAYSRDYGDVGWHGTDWFLTKDLEVITSRDETFEDLLESFTTRDLFKLLNESDKVAIKPLYLYDHSGISISTGSFVGRAPHAEWDSGPVGFIYMDKETAMKNMAMPKETLRIAKVIPSDERKVVSFKVQSDFIPLGVEDFLKTRGYERVEKAEFIRNLNDAHLPGEAKPILDEASVNGGYVYKKDYKLYALDNASQNHGLQLVEVAVFNPDLQAMTADAWKAAAMRELKAETVEYDNYLTHEVYGYQCFEGLNEVDSCWGFNPGQERIEDLMNDELRGWYGSKMNFEYIPGDDFNIEDYFYENDFPELRQKIYDDVRSYLSLEDGTSQVYPFGIVAEDLLANKDGILDNIVSDLYEMHLEPDAERIHSVIEQHAGVSRDVQPKLSMTDLEPGKEYTADDLMAMIQKKRPLNDIIAAAAARKENSSPSHDPKNRGPEL